MKKTVTAILALFLLSANVHTALAFAYNPKALKDSKPENISPADQLYLRYDTIAINSLTKARVLVNRITNRVEYVFHNSYKRYVRPKFVMPDAQELYNRSRS